MSKVNGRKEAVTKRRDKASEGQQCLCVPGQSKVKYFVFVWKRTCMGPSEVKLIFFHASEQTGSKRKNGKNP